MFLDSEINRLMVWTGSSCTVEAANPELSGPATSEPTATTYDIAPNGCEYEMLASGQYCFSSSKGFGVTDSISECFEIAKYDSSCHSEGLQGPIVFYNDVTQNCHCSRDDCSSRSSNPNYAIYQEPLCHNGCEYEVLASGQYCSSHVHLGVTTLSECFKTAKSDSWSGWCHSEGLQGPIVMYDFVSQNCHCSTDDCSTNRGFNVDYAIYQEPLCYSELYYAAKGRPNTGCSEENGCDTVAADPSDVYPVRCCSDVAITGWDDQSDREPGVCSNWAAIDIWTDGCEERTWADANDYCTSKGGRLCTLEEMEQGCARSTGCSFDSRLVWTSTSA